MERPIPLLTGLLVLLLAVTACTQMVPSPAEDLLAQSIAYHDANGVFMERTHRLTLRETRPDQPDRHTTITFDGHGSELTLVQHRDEHSIDAEVGPEGCRASIDGSEEIPDSLASQYRVTCEGLRWWRDYYAFLFALPMKLTEPGTRLEPEVADTTFQGAPVRVLTAFFDSDVGTDTWWLYLDPETRALVGHRFIHAGAPDEGEYTAFKGEASASGIRIPRERHWYMSADNEYLGADIIARYEVIE